MFLLIKLMVCSLGHGWSPSIMGGLPQAWVVSLRHWWSLSGMDGLPQAWMVLADFNYPVYFLPKTFKLSGFPIFEGTWKRL